MSKIKIVNIFEDINSEITKQCNTIEEIYDNIPFVDDNLKKYIDIKQAFPCSCTPLSIKNIIIEGAIDTKNNIFKKINKNSKNISNLNIESEDWEKELINKTIDELMSIIHFNKFSIHRYLNNLKVYKDLEINDIIKGSNHKRKYIEAVFASDKAKSKRNPSRDCIIGISFAFKLNLAEINYLLKAAGYNELYLRNKRDLIIAKSILEEFNINRLNLYLVKYGEFKIGNLDDDEVYP